MPQATPKRAGKQPRTGSRYPADVLADNVRAYRKLRGLSQEQLGEKMADLGHGWTAGIVGFVERGDRNVTVDELLGLALVLGFPFGKLLDPSGVLGLYPGAVVDEAGVEEPAPTGLDVGLRAPLTFGMASAWLAGVVAAGVTSDDSVRFRPVPPFVDDDSREALAETLNESWKTLADEENTK